MNVRYLSVVSVVITTLGFTISQVGPSPMEFFAQAQDDTEQQQEREFAADLTGQAEIPPVVTNASGQASLTVNEDGDEVSYELDVEDIEGVTAAHIHWGNPLRNGPILVTLYNASAGESADEGDGSLSDGDFASEDLPGWRTMNMSRLIDLMDEGRAYVNVHTNAFPAGEIRGNITEVQEEDDNDDN